MPPANDKQSEWTSLSGKAEVAEGPAAGRTAVGAPLKIWFPDGLDTKGLSLIKVHVDSAEYWSHRRARCAS